RLEHPVLGKQRVDRGLDVSHSDLLRQPVALGRVDGRRPGWTRRRPGNGMPGRLTPASPDAAGSLNAFAAPATRRQVSGPDACQGSPARRESAVRRTEDHCRRERTAAAEAGGQETVPAGGRRTPSTRKEPPVPKYIAYCVKCKEKREF